MDLFTFLGEICFLRLFGNNCISLTETTEPGDQFLARSHPGTELNLYKGSSLIAWFLGA